MFNFTVQFLGTPDYPNVISMSYGVPELENCSEMYGTYVSITNEIFDGIVPL